MAKRRRPTPPDAPVVEPATLSAVLGVWVQSTVAGKPSTEELDGALAHWGLLPHEVAAWNVVPIDSSADAHLVVVTIGGKKLWWPQDAAVVLTDSDKGRPVPHPTWHPNHWARTPGEPR